MEIFNVNNIALFAVLGAIAAGWQQVKGVLLKIISIFIRTEAMDNFLSKDAFGLLADHCKIVRWGNVEWISDGYDWLKSFNVDTDIIIQKESSLWLLYKGYIPIFCSRTKQGFKVTYFFGTFSPLPFFKQAYSNHISARTLFAEQNTGNNRFYIQYWGGQDPMTNTPTSAPGGDSALTKESNESAPNNYFNYYWHKEKANYLNLQYKDIGRNYEESPLIQKSYYWSPEALQFYNEVSYWNNSQAWFAVREIPYRRGALLYGKAGTGKTKMVKETAEKLGIPIQVLNISNMSNNEFKAYYHNNGERKTIILIEDIDCVFNGRTNVLAEKSLNKNLLSFDTLINIVGGMKNNDGIFLVITTNNIDQLDPALIRPGRCDVKIKVGELDYEGRLLIAKNILRDWPDLIDFTATTHQDVTVAEFENICMEIAVKKHYEQNKSSAE